MRRRLPARIAVARGRYFIFTPVCWCRFARFGCNGRKACRCGAKQSAHSSLSALANAIARPSELQWSSDVPRSARFLLACGEIAPAAARPRAEVAFAGRSNAGKSSAINALCGRRKLAFVSRTPGRTQLINFFALGDRYIWWICPDTATPRFQPTIQARWEALLGTYLRQRASVARVGAGHGCASSAHATGSAACSTGSALLDRPVHILLTKADKLSRQAAQRQLTQTRAVLSRLYPAASVQLFSSVTLIGLDEARDALARLLGSIDQPNASPREDEGRRPEH